MDPWCFTDQQALALAPARPALLERARVALLRREGGGLLVVGGPGSGKSVFLRRLAAELSASGSGTPVVPSFLDQAASPEAALAGLVSALGGGAGGGNPESAWEEAVKRAPAPVTVFADDLDGAFSSPGERARFLRLAAAPGVWVAAAVQSSSLAGKKPLFAEPDALMLEVFELAPLSRSEAADFLDALDPGLGEAPWSALALGNPRVLAALAAAQGSAGLPDRLAAAAGSLSGDFSPLYKALPPAERRVFGFVCRSWFPAAARDAGPVCAMDANQASALLNRLSGRGLVSEFFREGRRKWYVPSIPGMSLHALVKCPAGRRRLDALEAFFLALQQAAPRPEPGASAAPRKRAKQDPLYPFLEPLCARMLEEARVRMGPSPKDGPAPEASFLPPLEVLAEAGLAVPGGADPGALEAALKREAQDNPEAAGPWASLGALYHSLGASARAEDAYLAAVDRESGHAAIWLGLARLLHESPDRAVDAEQAYRIASSLAPEAPLVWTLLGMFLAGQDRGGEAEKALEKALVLDQEYALAWRALADLYEAQGRENEAAAAREKAGGGTAADQAREAACDSRDPVLMRKVCMKRADPDPEARLLDGLLAIPAGEGPAEAAKELLQAGEEGAGGQAYLLAAAALVLAGDHAQAVRACTLAADGQATRLRGLVECAAGQAAEAEKDLARHLEREPEDSPALAAMGALLARQPGREGEALELLRKASEGGGETAFALAELGRLLALSGQPEKAEQALRRSIAADPEPAWAFVRLGELFLKEPARVEEAKKALSRAVILDPGDPAAWRLLGVAHRRANNPERAERALEKAVSLDPACPLAAAELALFFMGQGRLTEAARVVRKFLEHPDSAAWQLAEKIAAAPRFADVRGCLSPEEQTALDASSKPAEQAGSAWDREAAACALEAMAGQASPDLAPALGHLLKGIAAGEFEAVFHLLASSPAREWFLPLEAALALALDKPLLYPPEILEMARGSELSEAVAPFVRN
ncbi:MAG: tetratricopeptide repeat protein [Deltaproteobacteria bacterium]|nr:tetratricopeptide repeat protein [Deltaproteobacteria bacterium]